MVAEPLLEVTDQVELAEQGETMLPVQVEERLTQ